MEGSHHEHELSSYTSHQNLTYQKFSDCIDDHEPTFDPPIKIAQPLPRSSRMLKKKKHKNNEPRKENVVLVREGNTITKQMAVWAKV